MSWRTRWRVYEYLRNTLWIVPFGCVVLAVVLAVVMPDVDRHTTATIGIRFGSDAARGVLGAVASGMITFTGFVFSILLLAVQFGSNQFSPRMLRRFLRDPTTKMALGTFMATFVYALMVLRVVGTGNDANFVPDNSISVGLLLLLLSMLMFLRLLSRTTQGLRVAAVLADLGRDARRVMDRMYPDPAGATESPGPEPGDPARAVGYRGGPAIVQSVDLPSLVERARQADAVIEFVPRFGDLVADGAPLFRLYGDRAAAIGDDWLRSTVATGDERNLRHDPAFAFRLLADISAKALSPGVNDPTTSGQALDQIELLLRQIGGRRLGPGVGVDATGSVRVRYRVPSWEDYLSLAIDETRQFGAGSIQVVRRLRALLRNVRAAVPEIRWPAIDAELATLNASAGRMFHEESDRLVAAASDGQGLGATDDPGPPPPSAA
ncbi:DUF2254 domain-containing protein [Actinocatenispora thailandica]|uniref:DUF2254 domain-containing protein n=1 Tax=Actinocatenispora thailandica TaxID=227318 RepID=UPI00194FBED0|nr:DUF2254 domain-containing protein [Actinocatenispora thailandica]